MRDALVAHLRHVGRVYPDRCPEVALVIDNAPWHRGKAVADALADDPRRRFYRLPGCGPHLDPGERFWE